MTDEEQKMIISKNLKRLIASSGKDQKQIAFDLRVNPPTFNQWVTGKAIPAVTLLQKVATYFDVKLESIVDDEETTYYLNNETAKKAQEIFENPGMRILFDAARDSKQQDLQMAADLLKRLKETNPEG